MPGTGRERFGPDLHHLASAHSYAAAFKTVVHGEVWRGRHCVQRFQGNWELYHRAGKDSAHGITGDALASPSRDSSGFPCARCPQRAVHGRRDTHQKPQSGLPCTQLACYALFERTIRVHKKPGRPISTVDFPPVHPSSRPSRTRQASSTTTQMPSEGKSKPYRASGEVVPTESLDRLRGAACSGTTCGSSSRAQSA